MKVKRMGITEVLNSIWLFSAKKIKSSESVSKPPIQLNIKVNSSLQHIIVTHSILSNSLSLYSLDNQCCPGLAINPRP